MIQKVVEEEKREKKGKESGETLMRYKTMG